MNYANLIKQIREIKFITQEELAQELGVNSITICRWETGKYEPTIKARKAIKEYCLSNCIAYDNGNGDK